MQTMVPAPIRPAHPATMTPRERLFAALEGRECDHVPVWLLFPWHELSCYADVRRAKSYGAIQAASMEKAITLDRRWAGVPLFSPEVEHRKESLEIGGEWVDRETMHWRGVDLVSQTARGRGTRIQKYLETDEDLEAWCSLPVLTDEAGIRAALDPQLERFRREAREFPMEAGAMMLDLGEPVNPLYHSANLESYAMWSLTHDDLVVDFLGRVMEQKRQVYRWCLEREIADVYFLVGSELASPPLVSRATFQRWIIPFAKELVDLVHTYGKKVILHYHGQIREILPDFAGLAPDGLHTIEAPPVGNCSLTQAYEALGDRITLIGNIQYDEFRSLDPAGMKEAVHQVLREAGGRRLILSPSAGPYEAELSEGMAANYQAFLDAAWEWRGG